MCVSLLLLCFGTKRDSHFHMFKEEGLRTRRTSPPEQFHHRRAMICSRGVEIKSTLISQNNSQNISEMEVREGNARTNTPPCLFEDTCWAARLISSSFSRLSGLRGADYKEELIPLALLISLIRAPGR